MNSFFVQDEELKEVAKEILRKTKDVASQTALQMDVQVKLNAPSGGINITFAILKKVDQIYLSK
jgi:hypothetical protein